jgi:predicted phage terminase large subunit-like protein
MSDVLTPTLSPAQVLLDRRARRKSLLKWCEFIEGKKNQSPALHHRLIIDVLQKITDGTLKNVILLMPPGAAKSTYTSVDFPPFYLANHPTHLILACSYSYTLIEGFGRQCRDIIDVNSHELGYSLSSTAAASGDWRIDKGGGYFCAGVGAGIAGHRADLGFIDDFMGSEEQADSKVIREKHWNWWINDFSPRLKPDAATVIIANRRHDEDLVGKILSDEPDNWTVIKIPFDARENDPLGRAVGEPLWPEWFLMNENAKRKIARARRNPTTWAGLYQQDPHPEEGGYFKRENICEYDPSELPENLKIYVGSDYAVKRGEDLDRFCFLPAGVDVRGNLYILPDWFWTQSDTLAAVDAMLEMVRRRKPMLWAAGRENITGSIAPFLTERMRQQNTFVAIEEFSEARDKEQKAQSIRARMTAKTVFFPRFAPGWSDALAELLSFPTGKHDDFVDALAKLGQLLDKVRPANVATAEPKEWSPQFEKPTLGWLKRSHEAQVRFQRERDNDK